VAELPPRTAPFLFGDVESSTRHGDNPSFLCNRVVILASQDVPVNVVRVPLSGAQPISCHSAVLRIASESSPHVLAARGLAEGLGLSTSAYWSSGLRRESGTIRS